MRKGGIIYLPKVSTEASPRNPRKLTLVKILFLPVDQDYIRFSRIKCRLGAISLNELLFVQHCSKHFYPFPSGKFQILPDRKSLQATISNFMKSAESSPNG